MSDTYIMRAYKKALGLPFGAQLFSAYAARKAPYFRTVRPLVQRLEPNRCDIFIKKRRAVQNHIGTMHVIAVANGLEMAMGFMAEASIPKHLRWIPKGMTLEYPAKANTSLVCTAEVAADAWKAGDLNVEVSAKDVNGVVVVKGVIHLWISEKPSK
ncbi:hotdog fold domain-containing protein [Falsihalocynthiibacter sp. SS001]|uniref:hotdog fold domain-containing protein n=1 Tax=Falsihalocynthiibacter sp. SS001 TaxID=3349698 RepID=UPI0036D3C203